MLGEAIGDTRGQTITTRVLPDEGHGPRMEITDQGVGTLCGVQMTSTVTYIGTLRPNGTISGSGTGVVMGTAGETATFRGEGVGTFGPGGKTIWRGCLFYESESPALKRLNGIAVCFEYEVDAGGKSEGHFTEWK